MTNPSTQSQHLSRHRLIRNRKTQMHRETRKGRESEMSDAVCPYEQLECIYLVVQRRPLNTLPWLIRWLLRAIYFRYRWAASAHEGGELSMPRNAISL